MSFYGNRTLSRMGVFSAFGGGEIPVFGPYTMSDCALSNFYDTANFAWLKAHGRDGGANYFTNINYSPPSAALKNQATQGHIYLMAQAELGNVAAEKKLADLDSKLKAYLAQATTLAAAKDDRLGCGDKQARNWAAQQQLWESFVEIVKLMKQFATAPSTVPALKEVPLPPATQSAPPVRSTSSQLVTGPSAGIPGGAGDVPDEGGFPWLYVGLGVGGLLLIGGVVALSRRSSVAGYRRRRRRSRR